jgi:Fe2+ transport system protein FeoA
MPERRAARGRAAAADPAGARSRLSDLATGARARLVHCELSTADGRLLSAMGLSTGCRLRVRKAGDPFIVEVRTTRIGLSRPVAERVWVAADDPRDP